MALALATQGVYAARPSLEEKLEILQKEIDEIKVQMAKHGNVESGPVIADSAASGESWSKRFEPGAAKTVVGGYGDAVHNNLKWPPVLPPIPSTTKRSPRWA